MRAILFAVVALLCVVVCSSSLLDLVSHLPKEELNQLCDRINHKSHQMISPIRCMKEGEDLAAAGKKFKATHNIDAQTLNPVVLLPGLGGSSLDAKIHKNASKEWYCFKNLDWFRIWFAIEELLVQPCWMDNLDVNFNPTSGVYNNTYGVWLAPTDFGGVTGVAYLDYKFGIPIFLTSYYSSVISSLEEIGYKAGQNLHGAPYDWRLPAPWTETIGWYQQLQTLIESTYTSNGNSKVHIVSHSMGGPTALYFLNAMTQEWLDTYIESFIPIAGPWTGAPNALRAALSGDNFGLSFFGIDILNKIKIRDIARKAGGIVELVPNTDLNPANTVFVTVSGKNYTIADFGQLFTDIGTPITSQVYANVQNVLPALKTPNVPVHCAYGTGVPTEVYYNYPTGDFDDDPIIDESNLGDGTVPLESLQQCTIWAKLQTQPVDIQEFTLVGHGDILHDDGFLNYLLTVITNQ